MPNWPIINCFGVTVARVDNEHRTVALPKITFNIKRQPGSE